LGYVVVLGKAKSILTSIGCAVDGIHTEMISFREVRQSTPADAARHGYERQSMVDGMMP
jgi:hypothetical protein